MSKQMKSMSRIVTRALLFLLPFVWHPLSAHALELVRDGQALAEIVVSVDADPSVRTAAAELQKYLQEMSGAELPIIDTPGHKAVPIYVGRSEFTDKLGIRLDDIKYDGFKRVVTDDYIALLGVDDCRPHIPRNNNRFGLQAQMTREWMERTGRQWAYPGIRDPRNFNRKLGFSYQDATGTLYTVYDFLEELGMRWFLPIEGIGQVVPASRDIHVAPMSIKKEPCFASRYFVSYGINTAEFCWFKWLGVGGVYDRTASHSVSLVTRFQQDRPELFAQVGGKTNVKLPRLASPELRSELADYLVDLHDTIPELNSLPIGHPDGWSVLDDRDVAAGWDRKEEGEWGRFSDYTWDFILDVAQQVRTRRPDARFNVLSYGCAWNAPKSIESIPADIAVTFCHQSSAPNFEPYLEARRGFLEKAPNSDYFVWDWYLNNRFKHLPCTDFFTAQMQQYFKGMDDRFKGYLVELSYAKAGVTPRLGRPWLTHLMVYLYGKFSWNKDLDLEATLADYYDKFFGPAQDEMREFYEFGESVWMRPGKRKIGLGGYLQPADVNQYFEILGRAGAKAGNTIYGQRVAAVAADLEPLKEEIKNLDRTGPDLRFSRTDAVPEIDGNLSKPLWTGQADAWRVMREVKTGADVDAGVQTRVAFRWLADDSLMLGVDCRENRMASLRADTMAGERDEMGIYRDDNIELHLELPDGRYAVIVVNANGAVLDRCSDPNDVAFVELSWTAGVVAARKLADRWTVEIQVKGLGNMPNKSYPWGVNVFRQRLAGGDFEGFALSPTGGGFLGAPTKMGNLYGP